MPDWLHALKPAAPARVHLLLAAVMWTGVGGALVVLGVRWSVADGGVAGWLLAGAATVAGLLKSRLVLDRAAGRIIERIHQRGDGRCLGGFVSLRTWGLVLFMMVCGRFLRGGLVPQLAVGLVYTGVGAALLFSARAFWRAWHRASRPLCP